MREGENPVPHYWEHVQWVFGATDMDDFMAKAEHMHLNGVLDRIKVPFLVTHGEQDRQIPVEYAAPDLRPARQQPEARAEDLHRPRRRRAPREPRQHGHAGAFIADWVAENLGGRTG